MDKKSIDNVFNMINQIKDIKKIKLEITNDEEKLFRKSYFKYKIWKHMTPNKWRKLIINYSIENLVSFEEAIQFLNAYIN